MLDIPEIPEAIADELADAIRDTTKPARTQVGTTLESLAYFTFGRFNHFIAKKKIDDELELQYYEKTQIISYENNLKQYLAEISDAVESVPEEKLVEPKFDIVGPAIEASKYYIGNEDIRKMFVNLIAASINLDTTNQVHHSYVEIIKQLSPLDASNLKVLSRKFNYPIVAYRSIFNNEGLYRIIKPLIWIFSDTNQDIDANAISLTNLVRLGLAEIPTGEFAAKVDYDKLFKEGPLFKTFSEALDNLNNNLPTNIPESDIELLKGCTHLDIQKGVIRLTPFGRSFAEICCC